MNSKEITATILLAFGMLMVIAAFIVPPPGQIHDSVLYIFAQILIYAGSIFGITAYAEKIIGERKKHGDNPNEDFN